MTGDLQSDSETKRAYHHGDLRAALVEAGLRLLEAGDGDPPGLREVARAVGVTSAAVYRHFPNRLALLRAMADDGLDRLAAVQEKAMKAQTTPLAAFNASGAAYVRFAIENPALYRLIFATAAPGRIRLSASRSETAPARLLRETVGRLQHGRLSEAGQRVFAMRAWAMVHGLSMLVLDGLLGAAEVESELNRIVDAGGLSASLS